MGTVVREYLILTRSNTIFQHSSLFKFILTRTTVFTKMKLLFASTLALLGVDANFQAMKKSYREMAKNNRNLLTTEIANVNKYGCWCYFDNEVGNGKGVPMDLVDAECRNLHRGYECAVAEIAGCEPWTTTYFPVSGTSFIATHGSIAAACIHTNTVLTSFGECAAAACSIETQFINEYTAITQNYNPLFSTFSHQGAGNFNPKRNCVTNDQGDGPDKGERQCCGTYPFRFPFKVYAGKTNQQACCGDAGVFVQSTHKCCGEGANQEVKLNGAAC